MSIIDLTMPIAEGMMTYPAHWHTRVKICQIGRYGVEGRETRELVLGTHTGTHVDAPRCVIENGRTIDDISLDHLCGRADIIDLRSCVNLRSGLPVADRHLESLPDVSPVVVLRYDWDQNLETGKYYHGHPYLSGPAVKLLIARGCRLLAMDTPSPDQSDDDLMPVHKILLESGIILVESLVNLHRISVPDFDLIVAPLKIKGGDGAPARVFAIE